MATPAKAVGWIVGVWAVVSALFFLSPPPPPPEWLKAWTTLIASVFTAALALRVLWEAPELLRNYIAKKKVDT
jgi:hypothetical protein